MQTSPFRQDDFTVRMDWGVRGATEVGAHATFAVIVDVLSFSTSVSVAMDRGIEVFPYRWKDESAARYADEHGATLAVGRFEATGHRLDAGVTLSPATITEARGVRRLVLPSPNGSTIAHALSGERCVVLAASLRNRSAVAAWLAHRLKDADRASVCVIAAGERWDDSVLRPAVEDHWGAGAIAQALAALGVGDVSPEAAAASATFDAVQSEVPHALRSAVSGRELISAGFGDDVDIAAELDASGVVPVLRGGRFVPETV